MEVFDSGENKEFDIKLVNFPFICRICLRRGDLRLFEKEDYLLDLFETITNIDVRDVRSAVNFPSNICNECVSKLEDVSLFIDISKYNNTSQEKNVISKKDNGNMTIVNCGSSEELKTEECEGDISIEGSEVCRICSLSCTTRFEEKTHLMRLFHNITDIDVEAEGNFSNKNGICNDCINKIENISLFISSSLCNNMKLENVIERNAPMKTEDCSEENPRDVKSNDMKSGSNSARNEVSMENYSDENAICYESKYLHTVVDIKKEDLDSPETFVWQNYQNGLKVCSDTNSVEDPLECDPCENEFNTENQKHFRIGKKSFKCEICEKTFTQKSGLKTHLLTHTGIKSFKCDICGKSFTQKNVLTKHYLTHTGEKPYKCNLCEKAFSQKMVLKRHFLIHTGEKPFKCEFCEQSFTYSNIFKNHLLSHTGEKPFKCDHCEKRFSLKTVLTTHLFTHTGEKPFSCDICKKSYSSNWKLKTHMRVHTGEKPFKCDKCEKSLSSNWHLQQHMYTHVEEKPFKCNSCEKSFRQKHKLKIHSSTHTGVECDCCRKSFANRDILKQHSITHTGKQLFQCDICKKSFSRKLYLRKHMSIHTGNI